MLEADPTTQVPSRVGYSVVILYYRAGDVLRATLRAVIDQSVEPQRVVVVDNDSCDGHARRIVDEFAGVTLVALGRNGGYAAGMNSGFASLGDRPSSERVLFLTHETVLQETAAEAMLATSCAHRAAVVGPVLERARDNSLWSAGGRLSWSGRAWHDLSSSEADVRSAQWLDGAALMVDRRCFVGVGGFDERFFLYWEDVDLCLSVSALGVVLCALSARASQETGETPPYWAARNRILLWKKRRAILRLVCSLGGEAFEVAKDLLRRRRWLSARGRVLGVLDGLSGAMHPRWGALR